MDSYQCENPVIPTSTGTGGVSKNPYTIPPPSDFDQPVANNLCDPEKDSDSEHLSIDKTYELARQSAMYGYTYVLKFLADQCNLELTTELANLAAEYKNYDTLCWFLYKGISPDGSASDLAVRQKDFKMVKYLYNHFKILPSAEGVSFASANQCLDILIFLAEHKKLPTEEDVELAIIEDLQHTLDFMKRNKLLSLPKF